MRIKNKAIVGGLAATAVGAAVVMTGASSAYFFDAEAVDGNKIEAGTLDLEYAISGTAVNGGKISLANLKPGDERTVKVSVTNVGSVDGVLAAAVTNIQDLENKVIEPEGKDDTEASGELDRDLQVWVGNYKVGSIESLPKAIGNVDLEAGQTHAATFTLKVADAGTPGAGNDIMSDSYAFDVDLSLKQK